MFANSELQLLEENNNNIFFFFSSSVVLVFVGNLLCNQLQIMQNSQLKCGYLKIRVVFFEIRLGSVLQYTDHGTLVTSVVSKIVWTPFDVQEAVQNNESEIFYQVRMLFCLAQLFTHRSQIIYTQPVYRPFISH